ncbi:ATP-binding protein [Chloroflexota bacterium]
MIRGVEVPCEELEITSCKLAIVNLLIGTIKSERNINEAFVDSVDELRKVTDVDWASIILVRGAKVIFYTISSRLGKASELGKVVSIEGVSAAWLADHKEAFAEPNLRHKGGFFTDPYFREKGLRSVLYLPLLDDDEVLGALIIASTHPNAYKGKDLALLKDVSGHIASAIRVVQVYELEQGQRVQLEAEGKERLQFVNTLAHELKTPLTAIIASAGLLREEFIGEKQDPQVRLIENIIRANDKLETRLSELLDIARTGSLGFKLNLELLDIRQILQDVADELLPVAGEKNQSLVVEIPTIVPMVWADMQRLEQVVFNLVTNAIKFTFEGDEIQIRLKVIDVWLVVEVEDHGPGITEEEKKRLFQPYYRIEADRQRFPGLGLGLAVSKQLIDLHKGRLEVESKIGKGSVFSFYLPIAPES